jgi:transcriptional regulator with XRE-family HTH domain
LSLLNLAQSMDITQQFGKKVRHFRKLRNLSQDRLAELSELHRTYIGSVERGERNITLLNANKIAKALSVSLAELVTEDD